MICGWRAFASRPHRTRETLFVASVKVLILRAAGINCDLEAQHAWELAGAQAERVHVRRLIERPDMLAEYQVLMIPGGFSYGDDIAAGRILAAQLKRHLIAEVRDFVASGRLVLGVCNGFQVLVNAGLLPFGGNGAKTPQPQGGRPRANGVRACTISYNDPPGFQDRWVNLRATARNCAFLDPGREYEMPIAHGEGRVLFADDERPAPSSGQRVECFGIRAVAAARGRYPRRTIQSQRQRGRHSRVVRPDGANPGTDAAPRAFCKLDAASMLDYRIRPRWRGSRHERGNTRRRRRPGTFPSRHSVSERVTGARDFCTWYQAARTGCRD